MTIRQHHPGGGKAHVRELRREQTAAEKALWEMLRGRRLGGLKFRRQFPISPFIADFCCFALKLIVELDGEVHAAAPQAAHDENRDIYLRSLGYTILRFPNELVFSNPESLLRAISETAERSNSDPKAPLL
ncbi:MAG TPA: endonuclease domain-containing protein [Thermoanaerobaculia bacterium]|jgi:very-short-patch-repair endonuclease|nr:endonuclease domain-containing protein [Thermoanaerobaculia bacterium]